MKPKLIIQKFHDEKYGKRLRIMTTNQLIGVIGDDGSCEFMTVLPVQHEILAQIVMIGSSFDLFYNIQPEARL